MRKVERGKVPKMFPSFLLTILLALTKLVHANGYNSLFVPAGDFKILALF